MSKEFNKKRIWTISIAHFIHDIYPAFLAPILPLLISKFGLTLAATSGLEIIRQIPSLAMPLIGIIADKKSVKYFVILTPAITAISMSLIGIATSYGMLLILLFIAGLSTVSFHIPAPVLIKKFSGEKIGKGMGMYMSAGAIAGTVGTFIVTMMITYISFEKTYFLMILGILTSLILFIRFQNISDIDIEKKSKKDGVAIKKLIPFFIIIAGFMVFQTGMNLAIRLFLPIYLTENGSSIYFAGISLSLIYLSGAVGMVIIGHISDKYSKKKLIALFTSLSVVVMFSFLLFEKSVSFVIPALILLGFFLFSSAPLVLSLVQGIKTERGAFVNSIYFVIGFFIKTIGIFLIGFAGDKIGLELTFKICAVAPLLSLPFLYFIPNPNNI